MTIPAGPVPALTVIIPAYNEVDRLPRHLAHVLAYLCQHYPAFELIVVDDGSRDGTASAVRAALAGEPRARLVSYTPNRGKGCAIRTGVLASRGEQVIFMDADLSTPMEEIPRALARLSQAEIVIGSRDLPGSRIRVPQPPFRRLASELFRWVRWAMVGLRHISDTQCGFKAYRGPVARQLFALAVVDRFMFDIEILYLADRARLRIVEMPVQWNDAPGSKVRVLEGLVNMVRDLWRIRHTHRERPVIAS
ncbi:MAG: glycosyltransferase family 2 protein [Anaerolineales bacterium]|nr:glycosyltransferase family 2 protein [Anaerolineales bacterium]